MLHDAVLQKYLCRPFAVIGGKLLFGLNAVIVDAQNLAFRASVFYFCKPVGAGGCAAASRGPIRTDLGLQRVVLSGQALPIALRLALCLLNQFVSVALCKPSLHPFG